MPTEIETLRALFERWVDGYGYDGDSDEDVELANRVRRALDSPIGEQGVALREALAGVYDECEGIAVPARETPFAQVEAYRETIRLLKARAANAGEKPVGAGVER